MGVNVRDACSRATMHGVRKVDSHEEVCQHESIGEAYENGKDGNERCDVRSFQRVCEMFSAGPT